LMASAVEWRGKCVRLSDESAFTPLPSLPDGCARMLAVRACVHACARVCVRGCMRAWSRSGSHQ
jgi:hypothetical protein